MTSDDFGQGDPPRPGDQPGQPGQPQYGEPQYGQPGYGQPTQPAYGQAPQHGQQYGEPPQYGQPQYGQPGSAPPSQYGQYGETQYGQYGAPGSYGPPRTNPLAIASLCCGIGQVLLGVLAGIPAIVLGVIALNQIRKRGERGRGLAIAGLVLGILGLVITVGAIIALVVVGAHKAGT
ncbi:MAG TPA: DUF4190 domain-containing protein [Streptosporangiaceae bacterium]|jgi:hypothetical protein